jgi:signal transduction histidine kinase
MRGNVRLGTPDIFRLDQQKGQAIGLVQPGGRLFQESGVAVVVNMTINQSRRPGLRGAALPPQSKLRRTVVTYHWKCPMQSSTIQAAPAGEDWPSKWLHIIVLTSFAGLLILVLGAGLLALDLLRQLQSAERDLARSLTARTESLSALVFSVHEYNDRIQQYLLEDKNSRQNFAQLSREIHVRMETYPPARSFEEQQMLSSIGAQIRAQEEIVVQILNLNVEDRHRRALAYLRDEVIPRQVQILQTRAQIALWSQQQFDETGKRQLEYFDQVRQKLKQFLVLALAAGIVLATGSLAYMLRLERQARHGYREVARSRGELQQLSARLVDAQEEERRSISRELHDQVGQSLGMLLVDAGRLGAMLPPDLPGAHERVDKIKGVAEQTLQTVRDLALLLRPSMLDDLGLVAALDWLGREVSRRSDAEVQVDAEGVSEAIPDEYKTVIYRVVQEALNNAARHSKAKNIRVEVRQNGGKISVEVTDDGAGFDPARTRGLGILGMEERVKRLGGTFTIESKPGGGATVRFELPEAERRES